MICMFCMFYMFYMCARLIILQVDIDQGWARTGPQLLSGQDHVLCPERTVGVDAY